MKRNAKLEKLLRNEAASMIQQAWFNFKYKVSYLYKILKIQAAIAVQQWYRRIIRKRNVKNIKHLLININKKITDIKTENNRYSKEIYRIKKVN